jgi:anti-sigma factor RsiW
MECSDIEKKLSAYIDHSISSEEKGLIDEHLKACQRCNESLGDLRKTLEHLQNLEEVEPPPWLTRKVMTMVRSEAESRRGILQRLFYPLHIKLPVEALATILVAVTTIYVFRTIQPEVKHVKAPPAEVKPRVLSRGREKAPLVDKPRERFMVAEEQEIPGGKTSEAPRAPAKVPQRDEAVPSAGAVAKREPKTKAVSPELKAALVERKERGTHVKITVKNLENARKEIEKAFIHYGGKIIKREDFEQRNVIVAELDSKKMKELFEELKTVGEVRERALPPEAREGTIEVRVEIREKQ